MQKADRVQHIRWRWPVAAFALLSLLVGSGGLIAMPAEEPIHAAPFPSGLPWLNVSRPLTLADLRGKVVILDFWTYGCINCMHVIPDLKRLEGKYGDKLAVIGVHSPKFDNEKNIETLRDVVVRYDLQHPVVNDVDFTLWRSYGVRAWPTLAVIDPRGYLVGGVAGEGHFEVLDRTVGDLLDRHRDIVNDDPLPIALEKDKLGGSLLAAPGKVAASSEWVAISDTLHHRVIIADHAGRIRQIFGGPEAGFRDGDGSTARFSSPQGVAFGNGVLFVADTGNHAIRRIDLVRGQVGTVAGNGHIGTLRGGAQDALAVGLRSPWDVVYRKPTLYIAMAGSHQIWSLDIETGRLAPFAGSGREGIVDGPADRAEFSQPSGLSLEGAWLYVADAEDSAVRRVHLGERRVETLVGKGLFDFGDRDGDFQQALLQHVLGVVVQGDRAWVADTYNHKLKLLDLENRKVMTVAGTGQPGRGDGAARRAALNEPGGLAWLEDGVLIADTNNDRIARYDPEAGTLTTWTLTRAGDARAGG